MKILRSVTRRGFDVGIAGYFTVLRPTRWFAASRLQQGDVHYHVDQSGAPERKAPGNTGSQEMAIPLHLVESGARDRRPMRLALIALAAAAITYALLWWMMGAKH